MVSLLSVKNSCLQNVLFSGFVQLSSHGAIYPVPIAPLSPELLPGLPPTLETLYNLPATPANMLKILSGHRTGHPVSARVVQAPFVEGEKEVGWNPLTFYENFLIY